MEICECYWYNILIKSLNFSKKKIKLFLKSFKNKMDDSYFLRIYVTEKGLLSYMNDEKTWKQFSSIFSLYSNGSTHFLDSKSKNNILYTMNNEKTLILFDDYFDIFKYNMPNYKHNLGTLTKLSFCNIHISNVDVKKVYLLPNNLVCISDDLYLYNPFYFDGIDMKNVIKIKIPDNCERICQIRNANFNTFMFEVDNKFILYIPILNDKKEFSFDDQYDVKCERLKVNGKKDAQKILIKMLKKS